MEPTEHPDRHERSRKGGIVAALVGVAALGLTAATTLAGFSASITNPINTFSSGTLLLSEQQGTSTCLSSPNTTGGITTTNLNSNCASDNFSGSTTPGAEPGGTPVSTTVTLTNTGTLTSVGGLSLLAGACTVTGNPPGGTGPNAASTGSDTTGFCGKVDVQIEDDTVAGAPSCLYGGTIGSACPATMSNSSTLATLAKAGSQTLKANFAPNKPETIKITVALDPTASNADQGLTATVPLTWSLAQ